MGLFKGKFRRWIKKKAKKIVGSGIISKWVSKIPVIGGIASGILDIGGGIISKLGGRRRKNSSKTKSNGSVMIDAYNRVMDQAGQGSASVYENMKLRGTGANRITGNKLYMIIGGGVLFLVLMLAFIFGGKKRR